MFASAPAHSGAPIKHLVTRAYLQYNPLISPDVRVKEQVLTEDTDWLLVDRILTGDEAAFDAVMQKYKRPVISFVYRMTGDASESEDITQSVFVRAYRSITGKSLRRTSCRFSSWLFQIARNAAIDSIRRRKRRPENLAGQLEDNGGEIAGSGKSAAEAVVAAETSSRIARAVASLPEDQRTAVILAEYEGFSCRHIAEIMDCSEKSVESRLYRARRSLRKMLADLVV